VKVDNVDEKVIRELSYQAMGRICPIDGFIGGLAAQEAMKVTRKCLPTYICAGPVLNMNALQYVFLFEFLGCV